MPAPGDRSRVAVDLQALQSPSTRSRGIGRYAIEWAVAMEAEAPELIAAYVLNPALAPVGDLGPLAASGKVGFLEDVNLDEVGLWHTLSPFDTTLELSAVAPKELTERGVRIGATVYDLIQALAPAENVPSPVERRALRTRIELVRSADVLLTLSGSVARALVADLGVDPARTSVVGAAPSPAFVPPADRIAARDRAIASLAASGLERPYVLAVSGSHPRKNTERVVGAFASLPEAVRGGFQLVLTGAVAASTAQHYRHLAASSGDGSWLVVAGHVPDATLVELTQGAALACVASLAEGYGLPIVEAQACGTPVVCSDLPPFDELVEDARRFDPTDEDAIANAIATGLGGHGDKSASDALRWEAVAHRSAQAFSAALGARSRRRGRVRGLRRRRPRLALVTPMPPAPSGVATYSYQLVDALVRTDKVDVDVFAEATTRAPVVPDGAGLHRVQALGKIEQLAGPYDRILYAIGNSHHHLGALSWLRRRPGVVLAHDVRLTNLYRHEHGDPSRLPGGLGRALAEMYGGTLPSGLGAGGELSEAELDSYGALMTREVIGCATALLVTSRSAQLLARLEAGPGRAADIGIVPFAIARAAGTSSPPPFLEEPREPPGGLAGPGREYWGSAAPPAGTVVLAHFGMVDPTKEPGLLLDALAELGAAPSRVLLAFVGPISDELAGALWRRAEDLALGEQLVVTGPLDADRYRSWLARADVALQLRRRSNGEASAAIGECLAAGIATVVSDLGWPGELPADVVHKLSPRCSAPELARAIAELLESPAGRRSLGSSASTWAATQTFSRTARALLEALSLTAGDLGETARA